MSNLFIVDAFVEPRRAFSGNPAAVFVMDAPLAEPVMQGIAAEMNLSETAFVPRTSTGGVRLLRWFTPTKEVRLCGHATLATAHVLHQELGEHVDAFHFDTLGGRLSCTLSGPSALALSLPAQSASPISAPDALGLDALGPALGVGAMRAVLRTPDDLLVVLDDPEQVAALAPDLPRLAQLPVRGVIVTAAAPNGDVDFVSRFFAPAYGVPEDPFTGSAHGALAVYWATVLQVSDLAARQLSERMGYARLRCDGDRVTLVGAAQTALRGTFVLPDAQDSKPRL